MNVNSVTKEKISGGGIGSGVGNGQKNFSRRYAYSLEASLTVKEQYKRITFSVVVFLVVVISVFYEFPMSIPSLSYFAQLANNLFHDSLNCKSFNVIFVYIDGVLSIP